MKVSRGASWIAALCAVHAGAAHAEPARAYAIAPQPLERALYEFAAQAGISISTPPSGMGDARSPGLSGAHRIDDALKLLLAGSAYHFRRTGDRAFEIIAAPEAPRTDESDVIVISGRRPTAGGDLPRDLTRIDAARLRDAGVRDTGDLATQVNGLTLTNLGDGRDKLLVRGVSDGALTGRAQSTVGIYLDDTRVTYAAPDPDLQLTDISSVEVLRGPQGALYGAGSIGGVMRIQTNPVDLSGFNAALGDGIETVEGGGIGQNVEAMISAPLGDRVGLRAVAYRQVKPGWIDNQGLGETDTNRTVRRGWRLRGLAKAGANWSFEPFALAQTIDAGDAQYLERTPSGDLRTAAFREPHDNDFLSYGVTLRGRTRWGDVASTVAMIHHEIASRYDATGGLTSLSIAPSTLTPLDERDTLSILVAETRLTSPQGARLPWFVGFFHADGDNTRDVLVREGAYGIWAQTDYHEHRTDGIDENAVFGEVNWRLSSALSLSTGLRLFQSRVRTTSDIAQPPLATGVSFAGEITESGLAPDIRLSYRPRRGWLAYISAAEGYRAGGFNTGGPVAATFSGANPPFRRYGADELWTYEAGIRLSLLNNRLDLQAGAFWNDWRNAQSDTLSANGFIYTGNVGDARAVGAEGEAAFKATDDLTLRAHMLINEPELFRLSPSFPGIASNNLPGAPEYSGGIGAIYSHDLSAWLGSARLTAAVDASYVGGAPLSFTDQSEVGDYALLNARLALRLGPWEAALYGDNLTASDGLTFSQGNPYHVGGSLVTPVRPRAFGLTVRRAF